jgi:hypothetical protein
MRGIVHQYLAIADCPISKTPPNAACRDSPQERSAAVELVHKSAGQSNPLRIYRRVRHVQIAANVQNVERMESRHRVRVYKLPSECRARDIVEARIEHRDMTGVVAA